MKKSIFFIYKSLFIRIFVFFIAISSSYSQNKDKRLQEAEKNFKALAYINARAIYLDVANEGYSSQLLYRRLADSFYFTGELEESLKWYENLLQKYPENLDPEYLFRYAQSLKSVERYTEADIAMEDFNAITGDDKRAKSYVKRKDYLEFIELQSDKHDLFPLTINSKYSDYAPSFNHNGKIVFASARIKKEKENKLHQWNRMPFSDLYSADIKEDQITVKNPVKLKGKINTKFHESSTSFSKDGKTVYFTRNNFANNRLGKNSKGVVGLKIYKATYTGDKLLDIEELPFCSDEYSVSHPTLSSDGKKLYFASDMPGSLGQSDLFVVDVLPNGKYGKPQNLGDLINTEGRETFPYISENNDLYFSSDGHVGLGGLDIFIAKPNESGFSNAYNIGKPINSPKDDFSFVINESSKTGYFASNRKGGKGNDDIYSFKQKEELITYCQEYIEGIITDIDTGEIITNATVALLDNDGNMVDRTRTDSIGKYRFTVACNTKYIVQVSTDGYVPKDTAIITKDKFELVINLPIAFKKEKLLSTSEVISTGTDLAKVLELETIYFDLDDSIIRSDAEPELQKIIAAMKENPDLKIEVRSHTDSRSSYWYNKRLSVKRMRATVRYIIRKGNINWRRIRGKAYGERRLINHCKDNVPCTEEEHQENRRSEFIVRK